MAEQVGPARVSRGRVVVIGAGPGGLSAALALHRAGFAVTVCERHPQVRGVGGAILLNAIGMYVLRSYGADVDDLHTVDVSEFRRADGRRRVSWRVDPGLVERAGAHGWISGTMRSDVYDKMLGVMPAGVLETGRPFRHFTEGPDGVVAHFTTGDRCEADLLVGADGITSLVRDQLWGHEEPKDLGIRVTLGWAELAGPDRTRMVCLHDEFHQFGYAPLHHRGRDCVEWWFVEKYDHDTPDVADPVSYVADRVRGFADPVLGIVAATDPVHGVFPWVVQGKDPLRTWSRGRATILGDAAHPTSPYAGYGAGMAIEDGFFLGRALAGRDLSRPDQLGEGLAEFERARVAYTNKVTAFARTLGTVFHDLPWVGRKLRDVLLDHTRIPDRRIGKGYTEDAQDLLRAILDAGPERDAR